MLEVETAIEKICQVLPQQQRTEAVALLDGLGRICAEDVWAKIAVPTFPRAGMDGYAVRACETLGATKEQPLILSVIATIYAGDPPAKSTEVKGTAVKIMTGAPIPAGFDAVIKQEWTDGGETEVKIYRSVAKGANYGEIGEDIQYQQKIIHKHQRINSRMIGVLASQGIEQIRVFVAMKIGLLATGGELVALEDDLSEGKIYNSNLYTIAAFLKGSGSEVVFTKQCSDEITTLSQAIQEGITQVDLLITTGGVSVGAKDYVPEAIQRLHGEQLFHFVNMKPGTPVMASLYQNRVILSLSGNPFAAVVNLHMFYWALLAHFMNCSELGLQKRRVRLAVDLPFTKMRRLIRAFEANGEVSLVSACHRSSVFQNTLATNCLIDQPADTELKKGEAVTVYYWKF
ncbi:molybdopterin molybdenumtransferase MoeA [Erwinia sp. CPCC 100877]|nr:molybdopterin molybdenumtransferase MoeA [Erwinia sp. CPCC 100877]